MRFMVPDLQRAADRRNDAAVFVSLRKPGQFPVLGLQKTSASEREQDADCDSTRRCSGSVTLPLLT
jgi:hypothetical protein